MAGPINHTVLRAAYHPPAPLKTSNKDIERDSTAGDEKVGKAHAKRGALSIAMDMHDDLSALLPSLRQRRQEGGGALQGGDAWIEYVLDDQAPQKCAEVKQLLLGEHWDAAQILAELSARFSDPSDLMAALNAFLEDAELTHLREALARARARHFELLGTTSARKAKAGLNVALKARLGADRAALTPVLLRTCYQDFMGGQLEPLSQYELWMQHYGFKNRHRILGFVEQALAADMYSLDPSCSRLEFGDMLHKVRLLSTLRSADETLLGECTRQSWTRQIDLSHQAMLQAMFAVVRSGGGVARLFDGPLATVRVKLCAADKVRMAQTLRWAFKALPYALWHDVEFQLQVLEELESFVVAAIDAERRNDADSQRWTV